MVLRLLPLILILVVVVALFCMNKRSKKTDPKIMMLPLPGDRMAVTMPPFGIYVEPEYKNTDAIIKHEKCHWQQYQDKGLFNFYRDYFRMKANYDYKDNPMEQECFIAEMN